MQYNTVINIKVQYSSYIKVQYNIQYIQYIPGL